MGNIFPILHAALDASLDRKALGEHLDRHARTQGLEQELLYLHSGHFKEFGPLHLLDDDTLGFAFSFQVPVVDTVIDGEQTISDGISAMLRSVDPGTQWQWCLRSNSHIEPSLRLYEGQPGRDPAGRLFADSFLTRWRQAQVGGFFPEDPDINFHPRSQTITVALKSGPLGLVRNRALSLAKQRLCAHVQRWTTRDPTSTPGTDPVDERMNAFISMIREILSTARANDWQVTPLDSTALVGWVADILFPQRLCKSIPIVQSTEFPVASNELRTAIAGLGHIDQISPNGFRTVAAGEVRHHRVVSMLWQPRGVFPGMLNALAGLRPAINVTVTASAQALMASTLQLKARALINARSTHRFNETEMQARREAMEEVERRLFSDGERILDMRLQIHVAESTADDADDAAVGICKHLEQLEMTAAVEEDIGSSVILRGCLPFAIYPRTEQKMRRRRRFLSRDCADLHPGGGCWTGIPPSSQATPSRPAGPIVMYSNPLGEPLFIDPTKAEKNPHALVVGQSGSGKSFFVHDYLLHLWRLPEIRLFLISIKADYRKLALLLGRYVDVNLDSDISLNPFRGSPTKENQARWFAALVLMLNEADGNAHLPREAEIALQDAALTASQRNWDAVSQSAFRETVLDDVCVELERASGLLGRQLAARLHPYRRGPYSRLFNAPRGISSDDRFVFFNLGNVLRLPCAALASFSIFSLIDEIMAAPELRAVPKGLIADEVWALVKNDYAAAILERSLKAYRSLGGFAVPIVQDPQDLDTPSGRVMLVNTATKIILPMDRSGQADLQRYVRLNERELEIVRNLRLFKRRYSEFFVSIDGMRSAKGILIPDPLRYAIATTDPVDEHRIEQYFVQSKDMLSAIHQFAQDSPYGLPPSRVPDPTNSEMQNFARLQARS